MHSLFQLVLLHRLVRVMRGLKKNGAVGNDAVIALQRDFRPAVTPRRLDQRPNPYLAATSFIPRSGRRCGFLRR